MTIVVSVNQAGNCDGLDSKFGVGNWMYIGRGGREYGGRFLPRSPLANPFRVVNGQRGSAVESYRRWLWDRIQEGDPDVLNSLRKVNEMAAVVCHCPQPGPCHGHVVIRAAQWLAEQEG